MKNLKELRKASGKNQSEIARLLGVTQQTYANYENGRTEASYDTLVKISKVFNLTVDELIDSNTEKTEITSINNKTFELSLNLGENIKYLRKLNNMRQEDICNLFNVARGTFSMWETGKREPDCKTLINLAKLFNVTVDYLIGNDNTIENATVPQYTAQQKNCIDMIMQFDEELLNTAEIYLTGLSGRSDAYVLKKLR